MRKLFVAIPIALLAVGGSTACATKKFVRTSVGDVNDNVGNKVINEKVGLERAQAVQRYLYEQYQIPLLKMNVISYGEDKPIAPNKTKAGRAQNRRVVIKVLA